MSLLAGLNLGGIATNAVSGLLRNLSKVNSTPYQDCERAVNTQGGYAAVIARYPHCAGILSGGGYGVGALPVPVAPVSPLATLPSSVPGGFMNAAFSTTPIPVMGSVPSLALRALPGAGALAGAAARGITSLIKKHPMAAGAVGGYLVDAAGNFLAGSNGRLIPARRGKRINPLNHRALKRALRRVKAARHICSAIERELPKRHTRAPRIAGCKTKCR